MLTKASRSLKRRWGLYLYRCLGLEVRRWGVGTFELPCVRSHWGSLELLTKVHNRNSKLFLDAVFVNSLRGDDSEMYQGYNNKMTKVVLAIKIFSHDLLGSPLRAALLTPSQPMIYHGINFAVIKPSSFTVELNFKNSMVKMLVNLRRLNREMRLVTLIHNKTFSSVQISIINMSLNGIHKLNWYENCSFIISHNLTH